MKKLPVFLLLLVTFTSAFFACNSDEKDSYINPNAIQVQAKTSNPYVYIVDLPGSELAFFVDYDSNTKEFDKYYLFQYDAPSSLFDVSKVLNTELIEFNSTNLKVLVENTVYVFTVDDNYQGNTGEAIFYGVGLSERFKEEIPFKFIDQGNDINNIIEVVQTNGLSVTSATTCDSGGPGSSGCSTSSVLGGGILCSVTCNQGYYACCSQGGECKCNPTASGAGKGPRKVVRAITRTPKG